MRRVIESDIPEPYAACADGRKHNQGRPRLYPWNEMRPGDSVLLFEMPANIRGSLQAYRRNRPETQWSTRKDGDGLRVWRLA